MQLTEVRHCEVCGAQSLKTVLDLGSHPMCDDLVPIRDVRRCAEYPIEILFCDRCLTAHQRFQIPKRELFPASYHYRARHTADVISGMRQLVAVYQTEFGDLIGKKVLDIGCNDGSLLSAFRDKGALTYGIEPTNAAVDAVASGHIVINDFLSEAVAAAFVTRYGRPDIISFTNVFAHIENLGSVLRALSRLAAPSTVIVIENHYLGSIIAGRQFDTFYHEHPRSYSYTSFSYIARTLGMHIAKVEFPSRYGGNIRIFLRAGAAAVEDDVLCKRENAYGDALIRLSTDVGRWRVKKRAELADAVARYGRLRAKAFPGRAAIPIKLLGLNEEQIEAVYEKPGSAKIGHYVPGTRIPILSDDNFEHINRDDQPLLNLAWHIRDEIHSYVRQRGYSGPIIEIISAADFIQE
jgi:SAM-dependent methyltransferase